MNSPCILIILKDIKMKKIALNLIKFYQNFLSLKHIGIHTCKFEPSCSEYTYQSINKYGVLKGIIKGSWRILKCNPINKGGYDPVK